jgi:hypothetical protein
VRNASDAHAVLQNCVVSTARQANSNGANIDLSSHNVNQMIADLQKTDGYSNYNINAAQDTIMRLQRSGNFESRQLANPVVFEAAYQSQYVPNNDIRPAAIQIAEKIHGANVLNNQSIMHTYDTVLKAGVDPQQMNLQRFYAAHAMEQFKSQMQQSGQSVQLPMPTVQMLDRIRQDPNFVQSLSTASINQPPALPPSVVAEILPPGLQRGSNGLPPALSQSDSWSNPNIIPGWLKPSS